MQIETLAVDRLIPYLLRAGFETWKDIKRVGTFRQLLAVSWEDRRCDTSIQKHSLFKPLMDGERVVRDSTGMRILSFNQQP